MIVGDGACGKTSLLSVFTLGYFPKVISSFVLKLMSRIMYDCSFLRLRLNGSNRQCLTIMFPYVELTGEKSNSQSGIQRTFPHRLGPMNGLIE